MVRYRLQALLVIKQRLKTKAETALAVAIKKLMEAREKLKKLEKEKVEIIEAWKQARKDMKSKVAQGVLIGEGNVYVIYLRKLKDDEEKKNEEIEDQRQVVEEAEAGVKAARKEYIEACKELRIMEKHKELWAKKLRAEISRREEREMDELGNVIHQLRRMRGEKALGEV
jgi:flagellar export protein FliJ